jgi:CreA protein
MKTLKTMLIALICISIFIPAHAGVSGKVVGEVDCVKRVLTGNDTIRVIRIVDPDNPFVAIFFTTIKSGKLFAMADPSNTAIAARLISPVPVVNGQRQINKRSIDNIASISKSIGTKVMKIARFYDEEKDTLCYLVYTTKLIDGSLKHSLSVVPLGMPLNNK